MRIPRIYHPEPLSADTEVTLDANASRHIARVLRLGPEQPLILFDGRGGEYNATILQSGKREVVATVHDYNDTSVESPLQTTLAQGVSKGDRMDYTIQKAVELGISRIVPISTERSIVNLKGDRLEKKLQHWHGIIVSACEQCGRNVLPELLPLQTLQQWLANELEGIGLVLDHRAEKCIPALPEAKRFTLLIGPEGGLTEVERMAAMEHGYSGIRLGPRVLRTETAALTALAALQTRFGDLG